MRIVSIIGALGTGKGTISSNLSKDSGYVHISAGDAIREEIAKGTDIGNKMKDIVDAGLIVPAEYSNLIMKRKIDSNSDKTIILDGYPRSMEQVEFMASNYKIDKVVLLTCPKEIIIQRLLTRVQCSKGHVYNTITVRPIKEGICDIDGLELVKRADDNLNSIENRFNEYNNKTKLVIDYYTQKNLIVQVDANRKISSVLDDVQKIIFA